MPHARFSGEEISRRGKELYEQQIRALVETEANIGKIVSIDIETGDYEERTPCHLQLPLPRLSKEGFSARPYF